MKHTFRLYLKKKQLYDRLIMHVRISGTLSKRTKKNALNIGYVIGARRARAIKKVEHTLFVVERVHARN